MSQIISVNRGIQSYSIKENGYIIASIQECQGQATVTINGKVVLHNYYYDNFSSQDFAMFPVKKEDKIVLNATINNGKNYTGGTIWFLPKK